MTTLGMIESCLTPPTLEGTGVGGWGVVKIGKRVARVGRAGRDLCIHPFPSSCLLMLNHLAKCILITAT